MEARGGAKKACQALITSRQQLTGKHSSARSSSLTKTTGSACIRERGGQQDGSNDTPEAGKDRKATPVPKAWYPSSQ